MGLDDLLALAAANNPTLRQAQLQVAGTLGKAVQAGLWPNPVLMYEADRSASRTPPGSSTACRSSGVRHRGQAADQSAKYSPGRASASCWRWPSSTASVTTSGFITSGHSAGGIGWRSAGSCSKAPRTASSPPASCTTRGRRTSPASVGRTSLPAGAAGCVDGGEPVPGTVGELTSLAGVEFGPLTLTGDLAPRGDVNPLDFETLRFRLYEQSPEVLAAFARP